MTVTTDGLLTGDVIVLGRIMPASNHTFFGEVADGDARTRVVYKPVSGERPLWDFTDGTLANREYAAWLVSETLGWSVVPPTVLRDGPAGHGMVQLWCEPDPAIEAVDILPEGAVADGFLHVLDAVDGEDRPVQLVHEDSEPLRRMAIFDVIVNNTDRKGGHVLAMADGHRYGVDHGLTFHVEH
ncbi:MAG: SCO1664 family protein, partial [Marmoricola sp.]